MRRTPSPEDFNLGLHRRHLETLREVGCIVLTGVTQDTDSHARYAAVALPIEEYADIIERLNYDQAAAWAIDYERNQGLCRPRPAPIISIPVEHFRDDPRYVTAETAWDAIGEAAEIGEAYLLARYFADKANKQAFIIEF